MDHLRPMSLKKVRHSSHETFIQKKAKSRNKSPACMDCMETSTKPANPQVLQTSVHCLFYNIHIYISIKYSIYSKNLNDLHSNQIASGRRLTRPRNSPRPASKVSQGPSSVSESEPLLHSPSQPPQLISLKTGSSWRRSLPEGVLGILQRSFPANPCTQ